MSIMSFLHLVGRGRECHTFNVDIKYCIIRNKLKLSSQHYINVKDNSLIRVPILSVLDEIFDSDHLSYRAIMFKVLPSFCECLFVIIKVK